jgi:large subunit ribosomal protein L25
MKLNMSKRVDVKKSDLKAIRRKGNIPSILYSQSRPTEQIEINGTEFSSCLRQIPQGRLSTTVFSLASGNTEVKALVKDIQYHPTTYQVLHLDFVELSDTAPVSVKVPVECVGVGDCSGIKLGGFLRQVIRYVKVECLPKAIPAKFEIDVKDLGMRQSRRVSDIQMPKGIRPLAKLSEVVVVIAKR